MILPKYRERLIISIFLLSVSTGCFAQNVNRITLEDYEWDMNRKVVHIPDIPGFITLKGDFHMHTIFSDGMVWPEFRVREAWKEGLDVIAITDHIENRKYKNYTMGDYNVSFETASRSAEMLNILLIRGTEITRKMPPGHLNALFLEDVNPIVREDPLAQIEAAADQGAFIMWNHPGWATQQPDTTKWWDYHTTILEKDWLHGVEVANAGEWYPVALDWCKEKNLATIAASDIHMAIDYKYDLSLPYSHRPMTLVFSKERTVAGVKEALFSRRTVGFTGNQLMGPEELIIDLFKASVRIYSPYYTEEKQGQKTVFRELENPTDLTFILEMADGGKQTQRIELNPHSITVLTYPERTDLKYHLVNCWTGSSEHPVIQFE